MSGLDRDESIRLHSRVVAKLHELERHDLAKRIQTPAHPIAARPMVPWADGTGPVDEAEIRVVATAFNFAYEGTPDERAGRHDAARPEPPCRDLPARQ